jgi:hypothetical protein
MISDSVHVVRFKQLTGWTHLSNASVHRKMIQLANWLITTKVNAALMIHSIRTRASGWNYQDCRMIHRLEHENSFN